MLALTVGAAAAQVTVRWLHIEANPAQVKIWEEVARSFEAKNPGVKVEMQFLENEAYKAKLPTILQSKDRPHIIYSWAGGVLKAQIEAGVLEDITAPLKGFSDQLAPAAVAAFTQDDKIYGVPMVLSEVGFFYNKELMAKAGADATAIKTWDDLLAAVKKLKAAGVAPIAVGGADKWPLHFYWTYLAMRAGGKPAFDAAMRGEGGGFAGETFVKAGELFKQLVDLQPFQTGFLGFKNQPAVGYFGDGKAALTLAPTTSICSSACWRPTRPVSATTSSAGLRFPRLPAAKAMQATRWAASPAGWSPRARRRRPRSS
jgi:raffinose/stachyose/melibiose transport system substrate-binding protein